MTNTAERLAQYYDFDPQVLEGVSEAAERQNRFTFQELSTLYGIENGSHHVPVDGSKYPLEVLKISPIVEHDETTALVYHTSHGYTVNENTAMHAMRLFAAHPTRQLIVVGNPSSIGNPSGKLSFGEAYDTYRHKTLQPAALPVLRYLEKEGIQKAAHIGFSYGADKAAVAMALSPEAGQEADKGVLVEPVSVVNRGLVRLMRDFARSGAEQQRYVKQSESQPYDEIWAEDSFMKFAAWAGGMARLSNLAIASVLARDGFQRRLLAAVRNNPGSHVTIGYGEKSELVPNEAIESILVDASGQDEGVRVSSMKIRGMHHAAVDDIDLHAAIMMQGLRA